MGEMKEHQVNSKQSNNKNKNGFNSQKSPDKKQDKNQSDQFQWRRAGKTSFVWVLIIISAVFLSNLFTGKGVDEVEIQYSEYRRFLTDRLIVKAEIVDEEFYGELSETQTVLNAGGISQDVLNFSLKLPFIDREVMNEWDKHNVDYRFSRDPLAQISSVAIW